MAIKRRWRICPCRLFVLASEPATFVSLYHVTPVVPLSNYRISELKSEFINMPDDGSRRVRLRHQGGVWPAGAVTSRRRSCVSG